MPRRSSNADRIARAAAEADAAAKEKAAKKSAKKSAKKTSKKTAKKTSKKTSRKSSSRSSRTKAPQRMKIIWGVAKPGYEPISHYHYKDKDAALAEAEKKGEEYMVRPVRVPMEDEPETPPDSEEEE